MWWRQSKMVGRRFAAPTRRGGDGAPGASAWSTSVGKRRGWRRLRYTNSIRRVCVPLALWSIRYRGPCTLASRVRVDACGCACVLTVTSRASGALHVCGAAPRRLRPAASASLGALAPRHVCPLGTRPVSPRSRRVDRLRWSRCEVSPCALAAWRVLTCPRARAA